MIISNSQLAEFEAAMDNLRRVKLAAREYWLAKLGLSEAQIHIVLSLHYGDCRTTSELAKVLGVSASAATQTTDTLARRGLITRTADPADRRVSRLSLTPAGEQLTTSIIDQRRRYFMEIMAELTPDEIASVIKALNVLGRITTDQYQQAAERKS
ncbi:MAG TPA: MarR family transcriptional regulator [Candidatus Saccharimonadia bacterium]